MDDICYNVLYADYKLKNRMQMLEHEQMMVERNKFVYSKRILKNSREQHARLSISLCADTAFSSSFSNFLDPNLPTPSNFIEAVCVWFGTNLAQIFSQRMHLQSPNVCFCFLFYHKLDVF